MNKFITVFCLYLCLIPTSYAKETERHYQTIFCNAKNGVMEYILEDSARIDCLTSSEAIEVDFAHKWAESIGQSLLYSQMTGKAPAVLLIVNENSQDYLARFHNATKQLNIKLYLIKE